MMNQAVKRYLKTMKWGAQNPQKFFVCAALATSWYWPVVDLKRRLGYRYPNSPLAHRCRDCAHLLLGLCVLSFFEAVGLKCWCEYQAEKKAIERYEQRKLIQDIMEQSIAPSSTRIVPSHVFKKEGR